VPPYARISDPTQRKGGGLERQTKADVDEFCRRFGFAPARRVRVDDGVSAFKGLNATPEHELGKFLAEAQAGLIPAGDCLLLENWDRLSRQDIWAAIGLVNDLRQLGIHVGRLDRMKLLRCDSTDPGDFFEAAVELMRGHSESAAKAMRNSAAWERKRQAARDGGVMTRKLPAWVGERGGKLHLLPGPAAAVRRIFALAAAGYGQKVILRKLTAEGLTPFGGAPHWTRSYVAKLLRDRRVLGDMQPFKGSKPDGEVIRGYYPAAVSEEEFYAARAGCAQRRNRPGAVGRHVNVFAGLLRDAATGDSYFLTAMSVSRRPDGSRPTVRVLRNNAAFDGRVKSRTFPFGAFEDAVFSLLAEIDPHEILNGDDGPDESLALARELEGVEAELADAAAFMDANGFSATIGRRVAALEARKADLAGRLAEAREKAAHPLSETWGQAQSLLGLVNDAPDPEDVRLRLRAALRRMIDSIWLLVVPRGLTRLCAVQIWFADRKRRGDYLILNTPPKGNQWGRSQGGGWRARSLADVVKPGELDLRRPEDAAALEELLAGHDLAELAAKLAGPAEVEGRRRKKV
jgi:DNA invertase Pin-like site-specific DNA recombinase